MLIWSDKEIVVFVVGAMLFLLISFLSIDSLLRDQGGVVRRSVIRGSAATSGVQLTEGQWASVTTEPAESKLFDSSFVTDGVVAINESSSTPVLSPYAGRVVSTRVQLGDTVVKGSPLALISTNDVAPVDDDIDSAIASASAARKHLSAARLAERRQHDLLLSDAGAEREWLLSQADLVAAESNDYLAEAVLAMVQRRAGLPEVSRAEAPLPGLAVITAPLGGVVVRRLASPGAAVNRPSAGAAAPLFTISDLRTVWILASVDEVDAPHVNLGQALDVSVLAYPSRRFRTRVSWIAPAVDPATRRLAIRAELPNSDLQLRAQMSATIRFHEERPVRAVAIPRSAVLVDGATLVCYVVVADRTLALRRIRTGRMQDGFVEVAGGLQAGDRVVTNGAALIARVSEDASAMRPANP